MYIQCMHSRIFRSGNSLAIRIPSGIAKEMQLEDGAPVEMTVDREVISIRKMSAAPRLDDLIARITPDNVHREQFDELSENERW